MSGECGMAAVAWVVAALVFGSLGGTVGYIVGQIRAARRVPSPDAEVARGIVRRANAYD